MSKISQKQQMNVPIRTKNNQEVQTDVNLIAVSRDHEVQNRIVPVTGSQFLQFVNESWMQPFSDYYLLNQLNSVIQQLKTNTGTIEQYKTKKIIDELAAKIHGLLARQLKISSKNAGYYSYLLDKEKQVTRMQIKYGNFEKKMDSYLKKIQQLQRQIFNLRNSLKIYQSAAEENELYKSFFKQFKQFTNNSKKITDYDKLLNQQILPRIKQFEINLAELSKNTGRDKSNKLKAAISRYALQLDNLSKAKDLSWEALSNSSSGFFASLEHLNSDDWIQNRINIYDSYNELRTRHTALLSLVSRNVDEIIKRDPNFKKMAEISQFIKMLETEKKHGFETMMVNGWIGLGVIHCHRQHGNSEQVQRLKSLIFLFQSEFKKLADKYPQLNEGLSAELRQFLSLQISKQMGGDLDALNWLRQILVKQTEVIHVDNVYNYYNKNDKDTIYYLRVLVKSLIDELKRINDDHKIGIQLDQGILELLKAQALDGISVDDIIALFRPYSKVCQVQVIVEKPVYINNTQTLGVPLRQEKAVIVADTAHFAVNLQQGVPYRKQIPYEYSKSEVVQVPVTIEKPYAVPTKVVEQIHIQNEKVVVMKIPVDQQNYTEVIKQVIINTPQQVLVTEQIEKQRRVPYNVPEVQVRQVEVEKEVTKTVCKQINKIFKVEQTVPKVYKQPKFEIVDRPVHHVVVQKQIEFVQVERPIIERHEIAKPVEIVIEKPIYHVDHCDCQKPEAITVQVEKPIYKQIAKQVIVQKCHFIQGNVEQKIVEIACHIQVPIFKQVIRQEPVFIEKVAHLRTVEQKLVVVDRQIPFFIQHYTPVELVIEKPVIVRDIKHVPVEVEQPVPIYIEKVVPKVVEVIVERIVQKIVEVPKVVEVQKIVQKIVVVPRIVQVIKVEPQIVQVPIFIQTPVLQVVQVPVEKLVTDLQQRQKIVQIKTQVLKIQKNYEVVQKIQIEQVKKLIEVQPESYPQIVVERIIRVVDERPVEIYIDRLVDRVIHIKDVIPVEHRVQVPIQVQCPVQIITEKPVFYKQPVIQVDVQRIQREKVVQLQVQVVQIKQVPTPYIQKQKQIVQLPGNTIILKEPELHIIQIEKESVITATDVDYKEMPVYLDIHKAHVIDKPTFVVPEKQVVHLAKPYAVSIQKPVLMKEQESVVVQRPDTILVKTRQGRNQQIVKLVTTQKLVSQKQSYPQPIPVPQHHYHVVYEQLPPKPYERTIMATNEKVRTQQITNTVEIQSSNRQIITKHIEVPVYMQKIFEKILMLPQIVEVQKKVYMVEQINNLIAKQVSLETHYDDYRAHLGSIQDAANEILVLINSGRQGNMADLKNKLNLFLQLLRTESRIPKIVQTVKQVEVIKQRDRPVLIPVFDTERQKVLLCIISDLVQGIKGLNKNDLQKRFSQRIRSLFSFQFGLGNVLGASGLKQYAKSTDKVQIEGKWRSWLDNYSRSVPSTIPGGQSLTDIQKLFSSGFDQRQIDYSTLRASLQRLTLVQSQRLHEIERLKGQYLIDINNLRGRIDQLEALLSTERYYKDLYLNELLRIKKMLEDRQFDQLTTILQTITTIKEDIVSSKIRISGGGDRSTTIISSGVGSEETQKRLSQLINQLTSYETEASNRTKQIHNLKQQNQRLRFEIDEIKLNIPVSGSQATDHKIRRFNEQWQQKLRALEQNHFLQLNHLREQLVKRITDGSSEGSDQFAKTYDQLMKKYTQISENQINSENAKRNLINNYEDRLRDLNKQLLTVKRDYQAHQKKSEADRKRVVDDYEKRMTSTSTAQQKELRRQLETLRRNYDNLEQRTQSQKKKLIDDYQKRMTSSASNQERQLKRELDQARRNYENAEQKFQTQKKRIIDDYQSKMRSSAGSQQRQLRRQLDTIKRNAEQAQQRFENEKKRIVDDYERRISTSASNQQKQLRRQLQTVKRNLDNTTNNAENEKKRIIQDYEAKLRSGGSAQQKQLRRQLESLKKNYENFQKNTDSQKAKLTEDYERRLKQLQDDLERAKTTRRGTSTTPQQSEQLQLLKDKIKKLQIELQSSKKQIESYQKSRLGQTVYASGIKQGGIQGEFQSPQGRYRSSGPRFQQIQGSGISREQEQQQVKSSQPEKGGRISKSGIRSGQSKIEEGAQEIRSSSSRISGGSEGSTFKNSMTLRQFMDLKKADDKDSIITLVMIKVIQKIQQQAEKGIVNSYSPSNIYLSNFNPNNIESLIVRFGAPITNKKSKIDGVYLSPEVLRGEGTTIKSVVFTLAVIWDELIHYELYYKTTADVENLAFEYKVRDTSLNPILRNTLFEMMSKDPAKRLDLGEAKRRLSLQRYIVSQGKAGTSTSRISSQSRKNL